MKIVFIYGPPASGKTTLGKRLAKALKARFTDLDAEIEAAAGKSVAEIFRDGGEESFRQIESSVLRSTIDSLPGKAVVSLGGGTLLSSANREACERSGTVICLDAPSAGELAARIAKDPQSRPLGEKSAERAAHYASFPRRIARWFDLGDSLVVLGNSIAPAVMEGVPFVSDGRVASIYRGLESPSGEKLFDNAIAILPPGEENKTMESVGNIWKSFADNGIGRRDTVIALGGGVTGDLTGFAAATWMRGIDWINVPTSLLAMVDASTGGKTGCDLPQGKNLAGAFHSPRLVVIDTDFLKTLPDEILADGRAEMIKHEIIGGLERRSGDRIPSAAAIAANLEVKVNIVRRDPFERNGERMLLNMGHTVGHAVEKLSGYRLSHGKCVAIGCVEEAKIAVRLGLADPSWPEELAGRFAAASLPAALPGTMTLEELKETMKGDKKRDGDTVFFALPCGDGDVRTVPIDLGKEDL